MRAKTTVCGTILHGIPPYFFEQRICEARALRARCRPMMVARRSSTVNQVRQLRELAMVRGFDMFGEYLDEETVAVQSPHHSGGDVTAGNLPLGQALRV